jgi:hypothetical protein
MKADNSISEFFYSNDISPEMSLHPGEYNNLFLQPALMINTASGQDTARNQQQREIPTPEQIRYWRIREVNKMFHGQHKEILPQNNITIEALNGRDIGLVLPSQQVAQAQQDWFTIVVFIAIALFASVRHAFGNYLANLFQSLLNYSTASRMYRERNVSLSQGEIRLEIFSYFVFGLFFYQVAYHFNLDLPFTGFLKYLFSLALVTSFLLIKKFIYLITGFIIENSQETGEFIYNINNHIRVMGILALPIVALIAWAPISTPYPLFITGLTIMLFLYLILLWRGMIIFLKKQFSIFYLFLYLCTLEILPLLLALKLIT